MYKNKKAIPISLSSKKFPSLKYEQLFTPYRIQWQKKGEDSVNSKKMEQDTKQNSKTVFTVMKNQLANMKNDVEKLLLKETSKTKLCNNKTNNNQNRQQITNIQQVRTQQKSRRKPTSTKKIIICKPEQQKNKQINIKQFSSNKDERNETNQAIIADLKALNSGYINQMKIQKNIIEQLQQKISEKTQNTNNIEQKHKKQIQQKQNYIQQLQAQLKTQQTSLKYLQDNYNNNLVQTQKKQSEHIQNFDRKLAQLQQIIEKYTHQISKLQNQNDQLRKKLKIVQSEYKGELEKIGKQLQSRINSYVQENILLKKNVQKFRAQNQALKVQKCYLQDNIRVYEDSLSHKNNSEVAHNYYNNKLCNKNQQIQNLQLKIMQLQNQVDYIKTTQSESLSQSNISTKSITTNQIFNKALKQQLQQNQYYKQLLKTTKNQVYTLTQQLNDHKQWLKKLQAQNNHKQSQLIRLRQVTQQHKRQRENQIDIQILKNEIDIQKKKQESLQILLDSKKQQIRKKDQFIKNTLKNINHEKYMST